ncbi:hypothetical protein RclHR1_41180001 [Rhizophagus clarus]|uniref:Uncharacterized protein n=1 Tax=Rhizophagus clarus TaxID=94130 RepID=A0A2Z6SA03_9GLOM|nr:hypothetical protein RclHR1_41180001 [Rhizophagus clarus]
MEEPKFSDDIFEQIKDFYYQKLTEKQSLLIDKLILNEELKERYKENGLCKECKQPRNSSKWCQCKFQQNFSNWTSGNIEVNEFIQKSQLKAKNFNKTRVCYTCWGTSFLHLLHWTLTLNGAVESLI